MVSSELIRRDPEWVTNDASGIKFTASHEDAAQNHLTRSPMLPGEPWRESQWSTYLAFNCTDEMLKLLQDKPFKKSLAESPVYLT